MEYYVGTLVRWLLVPAVLIVLSAIIYVVFSRIGWRKKQAIGLALVFPWIAGFLVFTAYPLLNSLYLSFTETSIFGNPTWVGLENYITLFTKDIEFWPSVRITLLYALLSLPIGVMGALLVAMLLNNKIKGIGTFRTIYFLPAVMPEVAVALLWRWMFNSETGIINFALSPVINLFDLSKPNWFGDPDYVLWAFIIMSVWGIFGTNTVVFLAGLQGYPVHCMKQLKLTEQMGWQSFGKLQFLKFRPLYYFKW